MQKARPTPKELFMKRVTKLIKVPHSECKNIEKACPEPVLRKTTKKRFKEMNQNLTDEKYYVPYNLPKHMRLFVTQQTKRKVAPERAFMTDPKAICDLDEQFYSIIEGRPLRQFCDFKVYMRHLRDITLFRANTGYLKDQLLQTSSNFHYERDEYKMINKLFLKCRDSFAKYIEESYVEAKEFQDRALEKEKEIEKILDVLDDYSFEFVKLRNQVSITIAIYESLSWYKKFLNSMSPTWWQERYDESCTVGSRICAKFADDLTSASTDSVDIYRQSAMQLKEIGPTLFFQKPEELVAAFENLSTRCIIFLESETLEKKVLGSVLSLRDSLKKSIYKECDLIEASVKRYEEMIAFKEQRVLEYQATFSNVLNREFEKVFASYDATKLFTCVQYVHTQLYNVIEDPRDNLSTLMRNIERVYLDVTSNLDSLNQDVVHDATKQMFDEDIKKMNRAHKAKRILKECDILSKALYTSFEPPRKRFINKKN